MIRLHKILTLNKILLLDIAKPQTLFLFLKTLDILIEYDKFWIFHSIDQADLLLVLSFLFIKKLFSPMFDFCFNEIQLSLLKLRLIDLLNTFQQARNPHPIGSNRFWIIFTKRRNLINVVYSL